MRGKRDPQLAMLTSLSTEELIPVEHPIRKIRAVVDVAGGQEKWLFAPIRGSCRGLSAG
jgi:hypothetical protein